MSFEEFRSNLLLLLHCKFLDGLNIHNLENEYYKYFNTRIQPAMYGEKDVFSWLYIVKSHLSKEVEVFQKKGIIHIKACTSRTDEEMKIIANLANFSHFAVAKSNGEVGTNLLDNSSKPNDEEPVIINSIEKSNPLDTKLFIKSEPSDPLTSAAPSQVDEDNIIWLNSGGHKDLTDFKVDTVDLKPILTASVKYGSPVIIDIDMSNDDCDEINECSVIDEYNNCTGSTQYHQVVSLTGEVRILPIKPTLTRSCRSANVESIVSREALSAKQFKVHCQLCSAAFNSVELLRHVKNHEKLRLAGVGQSSEFDPQKVASDSQEDNYVVSKSSVKSSKDSKNLTKPVSRKLILTSKGKIKKAKKKRKWYYCSVPDCSVRMRSEKRLKSHEIKCYVYYEARDN